ncbi:MAG TPA: phenylalanine--tRNA ligase beta subunit-related protein [Armatimonadota bacterium]|nr:phenylalanine--tRNA ligase beta subunit-related protein [Armatimonadota bacterium]
MLTALTFDIAPEVQRLGVTGEFFRIHHLHNQETNAEFEDFKNHIVQDIVCDLTRESIKNDSILAGFRKLHTEIGCSNRKNIASPENLLSMLLSTGHLPHVNLLVDIYNLVSIQTRLALGAHDCANINGNIHLRLTQGNEQFLPLGAPEPKSVKPGEYAYIDDANDILCRLEVRQVEKSKVTVATTDCFYIVQGNSATDRTYLQTATEQLISLTKKYCGGEEEFLLHG